MASSIRRPIFASIVVFCFSSSLISARSWGRQRKSSITSFCRYYGRAPSASRLLIVASQMLADKDGLWANYNDGSWPSCCKGSDFDLNKITPLIGTMERYWPFLTCSPFPVCHGGDGLFWAHEEILIDAGYTPNSNGTKYALTKIITTIRNAVGSLPSLFCSDDAFEELRICFYKPRDCDMDSSESSCPAHISLPKFNPILDEGE